MAGSVGAPSARHLATILHLLRYHAIEQRRLNGPLVETPGGIQLTPSEMEAWADDLEAQTLRGNSAATVPDNSGEEWLDT